MYTKGFPKLADENNYAHITNDETSELETTYKLSSFVKWKCVKNVFFKALRNTFAANYQIMHVVNIFKRIGP